MFKCFNLKSYKNVYNFTANKSEITVILGLNGSGKTTLLRHICGLNKNTEGSIFYGDIDLLKLKPTERSKIIAYMPQKTININELTVENYVLTARTPYINLLSNPSKKDIIIVKDMLKLCGVYEFLHRRINTLSGGELKKVEIAKILTQQTNILVLDEPTSHLDFKSSYEMLKIIKTHTKENDLTTIMTLHDPNLALKFADKIICLNETGVFSEITDVNDFDNIKMIFKEIYGQEIEILKEGVLVIK